MDFLWELFPEATIVHIKRHPVAVVASHVDQPWAPPTVDGALAWLKPVYDRWLAWKTTVDLTGKRYVEVRAEDLAGGWLVRTELSPHRLKIVSHADRSLVSLMPMPPHRSAVRGEVGSSAGHAQGRTIPGGRRRQPWNNSVTSSRERKITGLVALL